MNDTYHTFKISIKIFKGQLKSVSWLKHTTTVVERANKGTGKICLPREGDSLYRGSIPFIVLLRGQGEEYRSLVKSN